MIEGLSSVGPRSRRGGVGGVVAVIGSLVTDVGPWYRRLNFPRLKPPDWLFGPGWTVIFIFIATSGVVAWGAASAEQRPLIAALFADQRRPERPLESALLQNATSRLGPLRIGSFLAVDRRAGRVLFWVLTLPAG